jgi:hypothetical protein
MAKYHEIAVGWLKQSAAKGEYVSAVTAKGNPKSGKPSVSKFTVEFDNGEKLDITNFAMFFNENKKSEKAPDVQFVITTDN